VTDDVAPPPFSSVPLTVAMFDALACGEVDATSVAVLLGAERGRRLLLLQHVLTACHQNPALLGPLGGIDTAQALLQAVEARDPDTLQSVLLDPLTGMWLAYAVQIVEGAAGNSEVPPWVHLGGLGALSASAALRARMTFTLRVPAEHGQVLLPGLGRVQLSPRPGQDGPTAADQLENQHAHHVVTVRSDGSRVIVEDPLARVELPLPLPHHRMHPGWTPAPWVRAQGANGHVLRARMEHLDPAPHRVGLPMPGPLSGQDLDRWRARLVPAWQMLDADHPRQAAALAAGFGVILPLPDTGPLAGSSAEGFGAAALRLPATDADLACALVHEFMHSALNGLLHLVQLYRPQPPAALYYAPWRDDPRPLSGMLHGAYAFSTVTAFWRARARTDKGDAARRAQLEFAVWRLNTAAVLRDLAGQEALTDWGLRMVTLLQQQARAWADDEVEPQAQQLAEIVVGSHRATWRAHHVRPDQGWLTHAVQAWRDGSRPPPIPAGGGGTVVTDPAARGLHRSFVLARWAYARSLGPLPSALAEAQAHDRTGADTLLVSGDSPGAAQRYLARIGADPDDPFPWGGLGPALAAGAPGRPSGADPPASTRILLTHPERVRALHCRLAAGAGAAPDVLELASWLTRTA